jgi:hypothetical protein
MTRNALSMMEGSTRFRNHCVAKASHDVTVFLASLGIRAISVRRRPICVHDFVQFSQGCTMMVALCALFRSRHGESDCGP